MVYNALSARSFAEKPGSLAEKITDENALIDAEIDKQKVHTAVLTAGLGTNTAQETAGVDLASGSDATYYAVFVAPHNITVTGMTVLLTEAYKKDTTDAKIELSAPSQGTEGTDICSWTLPGTGAVQDYCHSVVPAGGGVDINTGKRIDLAVTATGSSTGTGYAMVLIEYVNR